MKNIAKQVEALVVDSIVNGAVVPSEDAILQQVQVSKEELRSIDAQYGLLRKLWSMTKSESRIFIELASAEDPKPKDFQGLYYLVAQTELRSAVDRLKSADDSE